jgi:hypothetical protein
MSLTFSQTQGNGETLSYTIVAESGYFEDEDIIVELIDVDTGESTVQTLDTDYTIEDDNVIFSTAPSSDYYVRVRRYVDDETTYSDFTRGNAFGADNLNNTMLKSLYQMQQIADGFRPSDFYWKSNNNAGNRRLTNLADAIDDNDAVNLAQMETSIAEVAGTGSIWKIEDGKLYIDVD